MLDFSSPHWIINWLIYVKSWLDTTGFTFRIRKYDTVPKMSVANSKHFLKKKKKHKCSHFHQSRHSARKGLFDALKSFLINIASPFWPLGTSSWHQLSFPKRMVNIHLFTSAHFSHDRLSNLDLPWLFSTDLCYFIPRSARLNLYAPLMQNDLASSRA